MKCVCGHNETAHIGFAQWCIEADPVTHNGSVCPCMRFRAKEPKEPKLKSTINRCKCGHRWRHHTGPNDSGTDTSCVRCGSCQHFVSEMLTSA